MVYILKHFDTPLVKFSATEDTREPEIDILWVNESKMNFLPLDLNVSNEGLAQWLKHRNIPKNRAYVNNFLSKCGLSINRPMAIIRVSKGLSLNDCYWVVEDGFEGRFADFNLYDNRFSQVLALIAFTGYGSNIRKSLLSCPEFTTNGMLPKCWRRVKGKIKLYKGGTSGAANTGKEPYSEYYAAQIANVLGIDAIDYGLSKWQGNLCSTCDLFTSKEYSFVPIGMIVKTGGMPAVTKYFSTLGQQYLNALSDMLVFDAVIMNTDRHFGNFGLMVSNQTNKIVQPAPLFDHGNSLLNFALDSDMQDEKHLIEYLDTLYPCTYDDFIGTAKNVMTPEHRKKLCKLLDFKFKKHSRYNLSETRLKQLEILVQNRAKMLLN